MSKTQYQDAIAAKATLDETTKSLAAEALHDMQELETKLSNLVTVATLSGHGGIACAAKQAYDNLTRYRGIFEGVTVKAQGRLLRLVRA